ncbi:YdeI/OmpD-associated family protein [Cohnella silvisoli]|uniref:YdeI/OmpD-associated family protein n=1 Tax=Cohnella silvisoli TaxID=2873699 RepID=A0ABV1L1G8_9BACL|nr:YdeI/OmpD-associated family protein [Cohnella silvisoli]MCD9025495.1 YdeI/OmpD-associated family protein [Cohnella silvisoli]
MSEQPIFFATPAEWRTWLSDNYDRLSHLLVGFYKKSSGKPSITWPESVDEALCYGWIDGVRKSLDEESYTIRFTPRKADSIWSAVNIRRVAELTEQGFMKPSGLTAFDKRKEDKSVIYSHEQKDKSIELGSSYEQQFKANDKAWNYFESQAPGYRKTAIWWVISAKREETRLKRLTELIQDSEQGKKIAYVTWTKKL